MMVYDYYLHAPRDDRDLSRAAAERYHLMQAFTSRSAHTWRSPRRGGRLVARIRTMIATGKVQQASS